MHMSGLITLEYIGWLDNFCSPFLQTMTSRSPDEYMSPTLQPGRSDFNQGRDEDKIHGREQLPVLISRKGSDIFGEGSRKTTASSDKFLSTSHRTDTTGFRGGYERQHSLYASAHTSIEELNETHPKALRPSFVQRDFSTNGIIPHITETKVSKVFFPRPTFNTYVNL